MDSNIDWIVSAVPWIEYTARIGLLHQDQGAVEAQNARKRMLCDKGIQTLLAEVSNWPNRPLVSHKSASHALHKLVFLADLGINRQDPGIADLVKRIMDHQDIDGPFEVLTNIPRQFGGDGLDGWGWALCDAPSLLYVLVKFGFGEDPLVSKGITHLTNLVRENGWPCAGSTKYGSFRGPGKKSDPCPYANLVMLKLLSTLPDMIESDAAHKGCESLLTCWAERQTHHPYIFYMGNDFLKLKAPLVWFDLLHVLNVLNAFPAVRSDVRLIDMKNKLAEKADVKGRFTAESVWLAWKEWEFGQKKTPSAWITLLALQILSA